jgi:hypothetical protein
MKKKEKDTIYMEMMSHREPPGVKGNTMNMILILMIFSINFLEHLQELNLVVNNNIDKMEINNININKVFLLGN